MKSVTLLRNPTFFLACFLIPLVVWVQISLDRYPRVLPTEEFAYLPSGKFIKGLSLSYDELAADLLWIRLIGYFADHARGDRTFLWFNHFLKVITDLDPYFEYPYEFGAIVLSSEMDSPKESIRLLEKGMANVPRAHKRYWHLPFLIAFNHMYYLRDSATAARYLEMAATFEGSPAYLPLLASRLYADSNYHDSAIAFLKEMIHTSDNQDLNRRIEMRILELVNDRNIRGMEQARDRFVSEKGRYPFILYELVMYGYLKAIPDMGSDGNYFIDPVDHAIVHSVLGGKLVVNLSNDLSSIPITLKEKK